jgi:hypothetical protein
MSAWRRGLVAVVAVGLLATGAFTCRRVVERGRFVRAHSSHGAGAEGTRALYLLAERIGARPTRWSEDLAGLPASGGMLVALGSCGSGMARELSRFERAELKSWIAGGGVLLVAGARHYLPDGLGVRFEPEPKCDPTWRFRAALRGEEKEVAEEDGAVPAVASAAETEDEGAAGVLWATPVAAPLEGLGAIPLRRPGRFAIEAGEEATTLLALRDAPTLPESPIARPAAVVVRHGHGRVVALASASPFENRAIADAAGGLLFARLVRAYAPNGPVLFDEYHLGLGERRSLMRYLRQQGAAPVLAHVLFVVVVALWRAGARFGGVRIADERPAPGTRSFVTSMGRLFQRADDPAGALDMLRRQALARIARHHHLPPSSARSLSRALRQRGRADAAAAVERVVEAAGTLGRDPGGFVGIARRIDALAAAACAQF